LKEGELKGERYGKGGGKMRAEKESPGQGNGDRYEF